MEPDKTEIEKNQKVNEAQAFMKEYEALCVKTGLRLVVNPKYTARDDNTFSLIIEWAVGELPKK